MLERVGAGSEAGVERGEIDVAQAGARFVACFGRKAQRLQPGGHGLVATARLIQHHRPVHDERACGRIVAGDCDVLLVYVEHGTTAVELATRGEHTSKQGGMREYEWRVGELLRQLEALGG